LTKPSSYSINRILTGLFDTDDISVDDQDLLEYGQDWTRFYKPDPSAVVFPRNAQQVRDLVELARKDHLGLVPSGGRTGMSGGACAIDKEIVVSFQKMNAVMEFDRDDATLTVEPGVVTANLQQRAWDEGLFYPVDFGSSGSSYIGGNIATNAGGIKVLRYGMTRNWVAGLKVVTGNGDLLELNGGLVKNNTGYDLRHLFVGSEGTLGFIVEATMKLTGQPLPASVVLLAVPNMSDCLKILQVFRKGLTLNAFEFFSDNAMEKVLSVSEFSRPIDTESPYYVLLEFELSDKTALERAEASFAKCLKQGLLVDGIIASSEQQNKQLWQYRERITESITSRTPYKNDIAVRPSQVPSFLRAIEQVTSRYFPEFEIVWFGHIGDGNLHLNILRPEDWDVSSFKTACDELNHHILNLVRTFKGSVSAEHGIGLLKKAYLPYTRSEREIDFLRNLKQVFDPDGVMNPGKLI